MRVRFSATVGEEPEVELAAVDQPHVRPTRRGRITEDGRGAILYARVSTKWQASPAPSTTKRGRGA